ncbi:hypothetical protein GJ496_002774 [Pomphorhynchus laevis]|nr:hypothetical protein GJ496_002774 [Pomphorhynchus laevis]
MNLTFELLKQSSAIEDINFRDNKKWAEQQIVDCDDVRVSVLLKKMADTGYVEYEELAKYWPTQTGIPSDLLTTILNRISGGIRHTSDNLSHYPCIDQFPVSDALSTMSITLRSTKYYLLSKCSKHMRWFLKWKSEIKRTLNMILNNHRIDIKSAYTSVNHDDEPSFDSPQHELDCVHQGLPRYISNTRERDEIK